MCYTDMSITDAIPLEIIYPTCVCVFSINEHSDPMKLIFLRVAANYHEVPCCTSARCHDEGVVPVSETVKAGCLSGSASLVNLIFFQRHFPDFLSDLFSVSAFTQIFTHLPTAVSLFYAEMSQLCCQLYITGSVGTSNFI